MIGSVGISVDKGFGLIGSVGMKEWVSTFGGIVLREGGT